MIYDSICDIVYIILYIMYVHIMIIYGSIYDIVYIILYIMYIHIMIILYTYYDNSSDSPYTKLYYSILQNKLIM